MVKKSIQIIVTGKVQNVGFRYHTQDQAKKIGIAGFVMNRPNGNVYIEAEGYPEQLDAFLLWCSSGPAWARVSEVKTTEQPLMDYESFEIKR